MKKKSYIISILILLFISCEEKSVKTAHIQCLTFSNGQITHFENELDYKLSKHDQSLFQSVAKAFGFLEIYGDEIPFGFYYNDRNDNKKNSFAYTQRVSSDFNRYGPNSKGYIAIGKEFANFLAPIRNDKQTRHFAYPFLVAHEMAHIIQNDVEKYYMPNSKNFPKNLPVEHVWSLDEKAKELNADYAAGLYCSVFYLHNLKKNIILESDDESKREYERNYFRIVKSIENFICSVNDDKSSNDTHGNCEERIMAFRKGLDQDLKVEKRFIIPDIFYDLKNRMLTN